MEHEYIEDIAAELDLDGDRVEQAAHRLGIKTLQLAVPPYGEDVAPAVHRQDADRLRNHFAQSRG